MISGVGKSWPMNIGGKPNWTFYHNLPSFVPIMFECTVLFAAHLMSITYFLEINFILVLTQKVQLKNNR